MTSIVRIGLLTTADALISTAGTTGRALRPARISVTEEASDLPAVANSIGTDIWDED
jgi:hypothetical protein